MMRAVQLLALTSVLMPTAALGWGQEGHSIVAEIAQRRLTAQARQAVDRLLGAGHSLSAISTWADDVRDPRPQTYNWHFVDIPLAETDYKPDRDCKQDPAKGDCAIAEIERARHDLQCGLDDTTRAEALKFLVHFVGDLHQPLHTVLEARGGNDVAVDLLMHGYACSGSCTPVKTPTNLHRAWDTSLIMKVVWNWGSYVDRIEAGFLASTDANGADAGTPTDWAVETHAYGQKVWAAVPADKVLKEEYFAMSVPVLDHQLGVAGLRLAKLLNDTLGVACPAPQVPRE